MEKKRSTSSLTKVGFLVLALVLLCGLVGVKLREYVRYTEFAAEALMDPLRLDVRAPAFSLTMGPNTQPLALSKLAGHFVLVHFWATWCTPCREELRSLEYFARRYQGKLEILAITVDDEWSEVERFFAGQKPTFTLLWDPQRQVAAEYGTEKFPETYLVDPRGKIHSKFVGARDWNSQAASHLLERLLVQ